MFTDVDVAEVIDTVDRHRLPVRAYDVARSAGMPDAVYADAFMFAARLKYIKVIGQSVRATRKGRAYARSVPTDGLTAVMSQRIRRETASGTLPHWAPTTDDFDDKPLARTPGSVSQ